MPVAYLDHMLRLLDYQPPKKAARKRNLFKVLSPVSRSYLSPKLVCKVAWSCLFEYFFLHEDINPWAVQ